MQQRTFGTLTLFLLVVFFVAVGGQSNPQQNVAETITAGGGTGGYVQADGSKGAGANTDGDGKTPEVGSSTKCPPGADCQSKGAGLIAPSGKCTDPNAPPEVKAKCKKNKETAEAQLFKCTQEKKGGVCDVNNAAVYYDEKDCKFEVGSKSGKCKEKEKVSEKCPTYSSTKDNEITWQEKECGDNIQEEKTEAPGQGRGGAEGKSAEELAKELRDSDSGSGNDGQIKGTDSIFEDETKIPYELREGEDGYGPYICVRGTNICGDAKISFEGPNICSSYGCESRSAFESRLAAGLNSQEAGPLFIAGGSGSAAATPSAPPASGSGASAAGGSGSGSAASAAGGSGGSAARAPTATVNPTARAATPSSADRGAGFTRTSASARVAAAPTGAGTRTAGSSTGNTRAGSTAGIAPRSSSTAGSVSRSTNASPTGTGSGYQSMRRFQPYGGNSPALGGNTGNQSNQGNSAQGYTQPTGNSAYGQNGHGQTQPVSYGTQQPSFGQRLGNFFNNLTGANAVPSPEGVIYVGNDPIAYYRSEDGSIVIDPERLRVPRETPEGTVRTPADLVQALRATDVSVAARIRNNVASGEVTLQVPVGPDGENESFTSIENLIVQDEVVDALRAAEEAGIAAKDAVTCEVDEASDSCLARRVVAAQEVERRVFVDELQRRPLSANAVAHFVGVYDTAADPTQSAFDTKSPAVLEQLHQKDTVTVVDVVTDVMQSIIDSLGFLFWL